MRNDTPIDAIISRMKQAYAERDARVAREDAAIMSADTGPCAMASGMAWTLQECTESSEQKTTR